MVLSRLVGREPKVQTGCRMIIWGEIKREEGKLGREGEIPKTSKDQMRESRNSFKLHSDAQMTPAAVEPERAQV